MGREKIKGRAPQGFGYSQSGRPLRLWGVFFLLLFVSATCTGCWDHREVEDLGIVLLTALDDAPGGKIRLEVQILVPAALAGGGGGGVGGMGGG
ncbi:MAG TPA: hypothetical protein GXX25_07395, partial [Desulfotomaculum sp.]|nr:hypothetical protein [Desulfotomaculum sp.]